MLILSGTVSANLVGLWNFDGNLDNDLNSRSPLVLYGSQDISFESDTIAGDSADVCSFPAFANFSEGIGMTNESGLVGCTNYTIILDVKFPAINNTYAALFSFGNNPGDGDFFVKKGYGIGIGGMYAGTFNEDTWYRVALSSYSNNNKAYLLIGIEEKMNKSGFSLFIIGGPGRIRTYDRAVMSRLLCR